MKIKVATNEENYAQVVLKRAIVICWMLLFVCFAVKIFGGDFFNIICESDNFSKFCEFVDGSVLMQFLIGSVSSTVTYALFYLAILRKKWFEKWEFLFLLITTPMFVLLRIWATSNGILIVSTITNIIQCFVFPFLFKRSEKVICTRWFVPTFIYGNIANFLFQFISLLVRNLSIKPLTDNFLVAIIYSIDMYMMLAIYYLYSINNKGDRRMSWFMDWLFGKSKSQLEKMKQTRLNKIKTLEEEVKAIDDEIKKQDK